jgi:tetratricopeptide (TPR) repeat protein
MCAVKTALAVHWAHRAASRFADGQLYVDLRGFGPSAEPVAAAEALRGFLVALGVPPGQVPAGVQDRAGLFRSLLASRSMLIVLDNAREAGQVRPLLPGNPACLVVVTSRSELAGLVAADGAGPLPLDVLTFADARELLARRLGQGRVAAEPYAAAELIGICARLPLALAIVAARAAVSPGLALQEISADMQLTAGELSAGELTTGTQVPAWAGAAGMQVRAGTLDAMDTGEAATSLRAVFSWSYRERSGPAARMFRLLGVHPGPDITPAAAASLAGLPAHQSRAVLRELAGCHLVTGQPRGRFAFHDLLRAYAADRALAQDSEKDRRAALHRMLDHYLHTAHTAALLLFPPADIDALDPAQPGVTPEDMTGYDQAMAWFEAEHRVLLTVIQLAAGTGFDAYAARLPSALTVFLDRRGYWDDYTATQRTALAASQRLADRLGQARAHRGLGHASTRQGAFSDARAHFAQSLQVYRQLGDRTGQARVCMGLAYVYERQAKYPETLAISLEALDHYRAAGNQARQANALNNIGWCHAQMGNYQQALAFCHQAISLDQELGNQHGEAADWDSLGYAHYQLADYAQAASCHQKSAGLFGAYGDRDGQAAAFEHLGDARLAAGDPQTARQSWQQALTIYDDLGSGDAEPVRAKLRKASLQRTP